MSVGSAAVLLFAVAAAAVGQLLLKHGMTLAATQAKTSGRPVLLVAASSPWIFGGLAVFAVSALAWLLTLSRVPLSVAYPFNALGYLGILTASILVLHERASPWTWLGTAMVVTGLIVVVTMTPHTS